MWYHNHDFKDKWLCNNDGRKRRCQFFIRDNYYTCTPLSEDESLEVGWKILSETSNNNSNNIQNNLSTHDWRWWMRAKWENYYNHFQMMNNTNSKILLISGGWRVFQNVVWSTTTSMACQHFLSTMPSPQLLSKVGCCLEIKKADVGRNGINNDNANQSEHQAQQPNNQVQDENKNTNMVFILWNSLLSLTCIHGPFSHFRLVAKSSVVVGSSIAIGGVHQPSILTKMLVHE